MRPETTSSPSPRRSLAAILQRAAEAECSLAEPDLETAINTLTGSWYGYALSGMKPPREWPTRVAEFAWTGLGGDVAAPREAHAIDS